MRSMPHPLCDQPPDHCVHLLGPQRHSRAHSIRISEGETEATTEPANRYSVLEVFERVPLSDFTSRVTVTDDRPGGSPIPSLGHQFSFPISAAS
jgi:hypothetical protein